MNKALMNSNVALKVLIGIFIVATIAFAVSIYNIAKNNVIDNQYRQSVSDLRIAAHQISSHAKESIRGNSYAFSDLAKVTKRFDARLNNLSVGSTKMPTLQVTLPDKLKTLENKWKGIKKEVGVIEGNKSSILWLHAVALKFEKNATQIHAEYQAILDRFSSSRASVDQVMLVQRQQLLAERIDAGLSRLLTSAEVKNTEFVELNNAIDEFSLSLKASISGSNQSKNRLLAGTANQTSLERIAQLFSVLSEEKERISVSAPEFLAAKSASESVFSNTPLLVTATSGLHDGIRTLPAKRLIGMDTAVAAAVIMAVSLLLAALTLHRSAIKRLKEETQANDRNQKALTQLLSEISELAEGNLAIEATVSEEFSGAIADSINFTIEQIRAIVSTINDTTEKVSEKAKLTQDKAVSLADQSRHQALEISEASSSVKRMAAKMTAMSADAAETSTVANSSVEIAKSGAKVVKNTIKGMDTIREQIQDTAKRIKRLGESSQEIGDIVSLITDIADQTNILALNASIQASMAGDAGRGFAVVADEVQRLAERSSSATRQIEALVRTIQSDTHEAVISMERTTSDVVSGASLTNDAGVALEEIERVSKNISALIADISGAANQQAESAATISQSMNTIKDTTSSTAEGTLAAANQVGELSSMTVELRQSVAGFKLPETIRGGKAKYTDIPTVTQKIANN